MQDFLILQLSGPMQSWGLPTFEGIRPSAPFPGRGGLLGLLGACLGIKRNDRTSLQKLSAGTRFAVRCDNRTSYHPVNISDFHTVKDAREKPGSLKMNDTIITRREYLYDASFTVAVWTAGLPEQCYTLSELIDAVQRPCYTPYLGRRCCPLSRPLFNSVQQAKNPFAALAAGVPGDGVIYSEEPLTGNERCLSVRDDPIIDLPRQFARRSWFVIQGDKNVPE
ncbi:MULTISPECIES: type I-E CRISPR-associated protein Cas5/CasD [unclassified Pantoea]|uniref:type I-E CRISPR-associated protein Cas5/CasD n=1 Tax=unclassified Pantoea TaxID=2630326 RepID=UPI002269A200|nr:MULTISPECIES: type I-E CRISPR-associated protein Cas5/CasD [unclassified Pantoea]